MAKKSSTAKDIRKKLAKKAGVSSEVADKFLDSLMETLTEKLLESDKIHMQEFGVFEVHEWKKNEIFNINSKSKEKRPIKTISFKPSAKLKEKVVK